MTAPGAMGKSMAARALAHELSAPIVDLSRLPVGSDSLTGLLARVLGWEQAPLFVNSLRTGKGALVLDALDEAQLAAGREHFLAFLANIANLLGGHAPAGQVVVFGRRDTVETAYLALDDLNLKSTVVSIAPLTYRQSVELIDLELDNKRLADAPFRVHRTHPIPFGKMRDEVLGGIATAIGAQSFETVASIWPFVADFLGYPPVLLVLAEHLLVDNPSNAPIVKGFGLSASAEKSQRGALLREVVEGILDRETRKAQAQLAELLVGPSGYLVSLYKRDEQIIRLLEYVTASEVDIIPPAGLSSADREKYDERILTFLPDHPFLRHRMFANTVFSDYVRAFIATAPLREIQGMARPELLAACPPPGPFFAHFVHALSREIPLDRARENVGDPIAWIAEEHVNDAMKSHVAGATGDPMAYISCVGDLTSLTLVEEDPETGLANSTLAFKLTNISGVLEIFSPVSRCVIISHHGVVLAARGDEVEVGPRVFVVAETIEFGGKRLAVSPDSRQGVASVILVANEAKHDPKIVVKAYASEALWVHWSSAWHQWKQYLRTDVLPSSSDILDPKSVFQVLFALRRILRAFHRGAQNNPMIYWEMLDRLVVGENRIYAATLRGLVSLNLISRVSASYKLHLEELGKYGVSWASVNGPNFAHALNKLHAEVCGIPEVFELIKWRKRDAPGGE
ncbi:hypothetical protein BDK92_3505 [Micromonospora pisi]|uniref:Uncharacterized protein n=1 Tax=Micromonospora pisi TaxID=589240 RepID=A0A495JJR2_9ACTN|nr:hypothetical protein BDK92_3505 [Micromonospora pisi]